MSTPRTAADAPGTPIRFTVDGVPVEAREGDSIAAAMLAAGELRFRAGRDGEPRGLFCGMGVCGECQVLVGDRSVRACLEKAADGLAVRRHPARRPLAAGGPPPAPGRWEETATDVLVLGAGPAGLAAAATLAERGLEVVVVDERPQPGGQYFKQPAAEYGVDPATLDAQFREGRALIERAARAGVTLLATATVWGVIAGDRVAVAHGGGTRVIRARRIVIAPGAYERPLPVPGWTLPGVMTTGAVQTLLRAYRGVPGKRVIVAGNGPLNVQVADELVASGARVAAIVEAAEAPVASPLAFGRMLSADPRLTLDGLVRVARLKAAGVPTLYRHALCRVEGEQAARRATVCRIDDLGNPVKGSERGYEIDVVCVNYGFLPQAELARALGCELDFDAARATWTMRRDDDGRTSRPHVFLAGDAGGLGGARVAMAEGAIAGYAISAELTGTAAPAGSLRRQRRLLQRHRRFQRALWTMFDAPALTTQLATPETLVCRCENLSRQALEAAISPSSHRIGAVKKATRIGMGRCQGRYCGVTAASLIASAGHAPPSAEDYFAPRPPFKPLPLCAAAGTYGEAPEACELLRTNDRHANISS